MLRFLGLFYPIKAVWVELNDGKVILRRPHTIYYGAHHNKTWVWKSPWWWRCSRIKFTITGTYWGTPFKSEEVVRWAYKKPWWHPKPPPPPPFNGLEINTRARKEEDERFLKA